MNTIDVNNVLGVNKADDITQLKAQELGKEDFLKLLSAQLANQDPTAPLDNKDLILQLSQFSTLEGMQNLNTNLTKSSVYSNIAAASGLIGHEVSYTDPVTKRSVLGEVDEVKVNAAGKVTVKVDGSEIEMTDITNIYPIPTTQTQPAAN